MAKINKAKQLKPAAPDRVDLAPAAEDRSDEDWTKLSWQGLSRAYGNGEPDHKS
jgi:hypothetical protein